MKNGKMIEILVAEFGDEHGNINLSGLRLGHRNLIADDITTKGYISNKGQKAGTTIDNSFQRAVESINNDDQKIEKTKPKEKTMTKTITFEDFKKKHFTEEQLANMEITKWNRFTLSMIGLLIDNNDLTLEEILELGSIKRTDYETLIAQREGTEVTLLLTENEFRTFRDRLPDVNVIEHSL